MVPPLHVAAVVNAVLMSTTSVSSISSKLTSPLALRVCALALASSVKSISATSAMVGASLVLETTIVKIWSLFNVPSLTFSTTE